MSNPQASLLSDASKRLAKALEHVEISEDAIATPSDADYLPKTRQCPKFA